MTKPPVLHRQDACGRSVVGVPLSNRPAQVAWLYEDDYAALKTRFGTASLLVNDDGKGAQFVRIRCPHAGRLMMAARAILGSMPGRLIHYRDGDRFNLRRSNLQVSSGAGRHGLPKRGRTEPPATCSPPLYALNP